MNKRVDRPEFTISVSLYLHGHDLDPAAVSKMLGTEPDSSHRRGERRPGKEGRQYVRKSGMWALEARIEPDSGELADYIDDLLSKIDFSHEEITQLGGLERAYVDIFMAKMPDVCGGGTCEFEMTSHQVAELSRLGVPVQFTISVD